MEQFLRDWRQDALNKAQYESAIFVGDKLLAITGTSSRQLATSHQPASFLPTLPITCPPAHDNNHTNPAQG